MTTGLSAVMIVPHDVKVSLHYDFESDRYTLLAHETNLEEQKAKAIAAIEKREAAIMLN